MEGTAKSERPSSHFLAPPKKIISLGAHISVRPMRTGAGEIDIRLERTATGRTDMQIDPRRGQPAIALNLIE